MSSSRINVASPNKKGPIPVVINGDLRELRSAIIVIQEWWGVNDYILEMARRIGAGAGTVTLVPDLYRGKVAKDREQAGHYMKDLDWQGAVHDIDACSKYLREQGCKKVGVTGFCMGGAVSLATAVLTSSLNAAEVFYGIPRPDVLSIDVTKITIPLQCHFGELDAVEGFSTKAEYEPLREKLETGGVDHRFFVYPNAGHAFVNFSAPDRFDEQAYTLSMERSFQFFKQFLQA